MRETASTSLDYAVAALDVETKASKHAIVEVNFIFKDKIIFIE